MSEDLSEAKTAFKRALADGDAAALSAAEHDIVRLSDPEAQSATPSFVHEDRLVVWHNWDAPPEDTPVMR
jgi:hypothetical protein